MCRKRSSIPDRALDGAPSGDRPAIRNTIDVHFNVARRRYNGGRRSRTPRGPRRHGDPATHDADSLPSPAEHR